MDPTAIPESVIEALAIVRASGKTNMFDKYAVVYYANELECAPEAIIWLYDAGTHAYVEALRAMGGRGYARHAAS